MARVAFTPNIQRHVACATVDANGATLREVLDNVLATNPRARSYLLDDQASLRKHVTIFIDGRALRDRARLSDPVAPESAIHVYQSLSGG